MRATPEEWQEAGRNEEVNGGRGNGLVGEESCVRHEGGGTEFQAKRNKGRW